jgi:hypothetical protein
MTQVEIAKKILDNSGCQDIRCEDGCPFHDKINTGHNTNCLIWTRESSSFKRNMNMVKQWLKEQEEEMIDLTVNQIVDPPVKCWIDGEEDRLIAIAKGLTPFPFIGQVRAGQGCTLTDPTKPEFKPWLTVEDVPVELWGCLYREKNQSVYYADTLCPINISKDNGQIHYPDNLVYLPLGQPLDSEWLEFGTWEKYDE